MQRLNRREFPYRRHRDKIIQFREGTFRRTCVDWQIDLLNKYTDLDAGIAAIRPIDTDFPPSLSEHPLTFYRGERNGESYPTQDDASWLKRFSDLWGSVCRDERPPMETVLADVDRWGQDLNNVPGLAAKVTEQLQVIETRGMRYALAAYS